MGGFIVAVLMSVALIWGSFYMADGITKASEANKIIAECEKTLPRDQHCVLKAVPESVETEQKGKDAL